MGLEEVDGFKEARKERNSIVMGSIWYRKVRIGKSINPNDENEVIGSGKLKEVSNSLWKCKVSKRDEETQRK